MDAGPGGSGPCVFLTDLREELVVYIGDEPFSLREVRAEVRWIATTCLPELKSSFLALLLACKGHRPTQSIKMASIPGPAVEDLEARLKADVLAEAAACGGRILVHREPASVDHSAPQDSWARTEDTRATVSVEPYWCVSSLGANITAAFFMEPPLTLLVGHRRLVDATSVLTTRELCSRLQVCHAACVRHWRRMLT